MSSPVIAPPLSGNILGAVDSAFVAAEWRDAGGPPGPPRLIAPPHVARYLLVDSLIVIRARRKTAASISSVNLPVEVFCWLGW